jgi:hypothetical protein
MKFPQLLLLSGARRDEGARNDLRHLRSSAANKAVAVIGLLRPSAVPQLVAETLAALSIDAAH